ncbi:hypothetical protein [Jeongeupia chitinilytica]|uniref:Uncharacterized protein n=1 Tax=Jeongeupia chitinilytica TaxID=1041641 RepID=A0ABQ3H0W8_9NEIS|nr:hypothetical protein [Jeongeupia chitinilytica]GHD59456.1 hypothetical protein GCM10007350_10960 [Jeongeupia chitinilytica]
MLDIQGAIRLLDDWGRWSCPLPGNGFAACLYMTPEERIQAGATSRPSSVNEDEVMRVEAVIATLPESTRLLLRKHYVFKANPKRVCEQLRLPRVPRKCSG